MKASALIVEHGTPAARTRLARLERRGAHASGRIASAVRAILEAVRTRGDAALLAYTRRFDGVRLTPAQLRVPADELAAAYRDLPARVRRDLALAARRIRRFHRDRVERSWTMRDDLGTRLGQLVRPLARVGIYAPGGRAAYPSTVLMTAVPARVAGVGEIFVTSPAGPEGYSPVLLAACHLAGVDALYRVGGAQAIGALAYGTATIPPVDKIVGPGNIWVATAKQLVYGTVDIDAIAGPSEICIVADGSAAPGLVAADLLAQAEHDPLAAAVCLTPTRQLARRIAVALDEQLAALPRREVAARALAAYGAIVVTDTLAEAFELADRLAPEHLEVLVRSPRRWVPRLRNAGAIFLGPCTPEAFGDYLAGPSHVLPTGGTARFASPLGVHDFVKRTSLIEGSRRALRELGPAVARLARLEGLDAHARSVESRLVLQGGPR